MNKEEETKLIEDFLEWLLHKNYFVCEEEVDKSGTMLYYAPLGDAINDIYDEFIAERFPKEKE